MAEGGDSNDGLWMLFFVLLFISALFYGIWFLFKPQVLQGYLWIRQGEIAVGSLWTDDDYTVNVVVAGENTQMSFGEAHKLIDSLTPQILLNDDFKTWEIITATSTVVLKPLRIPFGIGFLVLIYMTLLKGPTTHFRKTYGLDSLIDTQSNTFKVVKPFVNFNPLTDVPPRAPGAPVPAELPIFAEALGPEEWLAFHKIPMPDGQLDNKSCENAFKIQLGQKWQGAKKLPPYAQVLLASFALKASRKRTEADDLLGEIAESWSHKSGLKLRGETLSKARKILRNKDLSGQVIAACNHHAYVTPALLGALETARSEGGVLAPAQFVWLRAHDRNLWYPLNNLGRSSFHMEAIGAMSHYKAEKLVERPIPKPMMDDAVIALQGYISDPKKLQPIPQLDFSMVKNKKDSAKNQGVMKPVGT